MLVSRCDKGWASPGLARPCQGRVLLVTWVVLLLNFSSVYCESPSNVAWKKPANQSSTFDGTDTYVTPPLTYRASADLAVDGAPTKSYLNKTCALTAWLNSPYCTDNPWWQVNLGGQYDVFNVTIYQRGEGETDKQNYGPLVVRVGNHVEHRESRKSYYNRPVVSIPLSPPVTASTVTISITGCSILQLCEVEVYAVEFVDDCTSNPCLNGGSCIDGFERYSCVCAPGFTGAHCKVDIDECEFSKCQNKGTCKDMINSYACECQPGYIGSHCESECSNGTYGSECLYKCSPFCLESSDKGGQHCDHKSGKCVVETGCKEDYTDPNCQTQPGAGNARIAVAVILSIVAVGAGVAAFFIAKRFGKSKCPISIRGRKRAVGEDGEDPQYVVENNIYSNDSSLDQSPMRITSAQLQAIVAKTREDESALAEEYQRLAQGLQLAHSAALEPANKAKNRYNNICPYDHSRVVLSTLPGDPHSDYINACYVDGYGKSKAFIAAQGPTDVTVEDFLRMIWETGVDKVAMLTLTMEGNKVKCMQYWEDRRDAVFGRFTVKVTDVAVKKDFTVRRFIIKLQTGELRQVTHFLFTTWPDKDVPESAWPLIDFRDRVMTSAGYGSKPVLVHCSAGIGRTGTLIALDVLLRQLLQAGAVNVFETVAALRQSRMDMVQTLPQYTFLHEAALAGQCSAGRVIPLASFPSDPVATSKAKIEKEYKALALTVRQLTKEECSLAYMADNRPANRNQDIVPGDKDAVYLTEEVDGYDRYLNGVFLPSYLEKKRYILTQTPLPSTVVNFWRAVLESNAKVVVSLDRIKPDSKAAVGAYVPLDQTTPLQHGPVTLTLVRTEEHQDYIVRIIDVALEEGPTRQVHQYHVTMWPEKDRVPSNPQLMVSAAHAVLNCAPPKTGPILVHCRDGGRRSGVYVALSTLLERSDSEAEVAVPCVVGVLASVRPMALPSQEQYAFLYKAMMDHAIDSLTYENAPFPKKSASRSK